MIVAIKKAAEGKQTTRQERGLQIAQAGKITQTQNGFIVQSQRGNGAYLVCSSGTKTTCTCPDCESNGGKCKHQWAVEYFLHKTVNANGDTTTITKIARITYPQNWKAYNPAQTNEVELFDVLLKDLVNSVEDSPYVFGRPRLRLTDTLFCSIRKVYSLLSQRRAHTFYRNAEDEKQIDHAPHFNAVGKLLNKESTTPILNRLLILSALPLKDFETTFAPDSSGFSTTKFHEYCKEKHGAKKEHNWVKAHILMGTKTHIITGARITAGEANDCPQFKPMVKEAHQSGFTLKEIPADMGYSSRDNYELAQSIGATAYIPFKSNANGRARGSGMWKKMFHYFHLKHDEFMEHYHARSNVESGFNMIKAKIGDSLKSKNFTAQKNELLCKLIAHNVVVLIHETYELGITPEFG